MEISVTEVGMRRPLVAGHGYPRTYRVFVEPVTEAEVTHSYHYIVGGQGSANQGILM